MQETAENWGRLAIALVLALVIGGIESWAQGWLPDALRPLSNSASGWTLGTAVLVYWSRARSWRAALLGALANLLLVLGYTAVSTWRGFVYSPMLWGAIGLVVGPFVGLAAAWLRERGARLALGVGVLSGIALGEGGYGLTVVAADTGVAYWVAIVVLGVALLVWAMARRIQGWRFAALTILATVVVAVCLSVGMRLI